MSRFCQNSRPALSIKLGINSRSCHAGTMPIGSFEPDRSVPIPKDVGASLRISPIQGPGPGQVLFFVDARLGSHAGPRTGKACRGQTIRAV